MPGEIVIRGAQTHNLKNISVVIPREKLVVISGVSGSGKSSLAFDTLFAEGQRRYVESLSAYARQFMGQMKKPPVDSIDGLSPAIAIDQKTTSWNPRSTVGTVTEIFDHLRLLYSRIGTPHCPNCGNEVSRRTVQNIVDEILRRFEGQRIALLAPVIREKKGTYIKDLEKYASMGFTRARLDGDIIELEEPWPELDRYKTHTIEIFTDRMKVNLAKKDTRVRLTGSVEQALELTGSVVTVLDLEDESNERPFSDQNACADCNISLPEFEPRSFSFNSAFGACPDCNGLGRVDALDPALIVSDPSISIADGAITGFGGITQSWVRTILRSAAEHFEMDIHLPFEQMPEEHQEIILYGHPEPFKQVFESKASGSKFERTKSFEGMVGMISRWYNSENTSARSRDRLLNFHRQSNCRTCGGLKLRKESLGVTLGEKNIIEVTQLSVKEALEHFEDLELDERQRTIGEEVLKEVNERLSFMNNVGLDYLTLDRRSVTLSGGENQRIRLATQIGSRLCGVLYVLDEPSIGLHDQDNARLLETLRGLRDLGNTVVMVEHDEEAIRYADHLIDLGTGAGIHGGELVAEGPPDDLEVYGESLTAQYLDGTLGIPLPKKRRAGNAGLLEVKKASQHNLKEIDVKFPLGRLILVTGVSGSGKSTLVNDILSRALHRKLMGSEVRPGQHNSIKGMEKVNKVITIDQSPIGRTPRSNPATYTKAFGTIRKLFSDTKESRLRGYKPGRFSFNVAGGRCEFCGGAGVEKIEMQFLPAVYITCNHCDGQRYNRETLEVTYKGKNIYEVLDMTVEEGLEFFAKIPALNRIIGTLDDVGLGYIKLGQQATTLSGGEAQRVKIANQLARPSAKDTVYILDEPTTGLHLEDIKKLVDVLHRLVDMGSTVICIEHQLDVIKHADYIVDLGPRGGPEGGELVASGTPEQVIKAGTATGAALERVMGKKRVRALRPK